MPRPNSFTLIELLIVVGVVAILSVAVVMALNPTQLMAQGRDATRLNDLDTLNHALVLYGAERSAFGSANTIYVSVPDPTIATTNGTSTCSGLGLSTANLPSGWTYQCASTSSVQDVDGTGWLPVNFTQITSKPLSQLPIDPVNTTSSGNYYTYVTNGSQWELTSIAESQKYKSQTNSKTPFQPGLLAQGSNLALSPLFNSSGLIGYWPMDEGTGTIAYDQSGSGNNGTWNGTPTGLNGSFYGAGKVGPYAAQVSSSTPSWVDLTNAYAAYIQAPSITPAAGMPNFTISAWIDRTSALPTGGIPFGKMGFNSGILDTQCAFWDSSSSNVWVNYSMSANTWYFATFSYNPSNQMGYCYINGQQTGTLNMVGRNLLAITQHLTVGGQSPWLFTGLVDDARIYNRVLSTSEIQAIYNATK